jgi:Glycosyl transferase family 2
MRLLIHMHSMSSNASATYEGASIAAPLEGAALPTVSVIVPCYNYGHFLEECVRSVLTQQGVDVELLIIDDRSTDDSAETAHRLAERDARIELRRHSRNVGLIATANEGIEWAQGEFVVLLSADDLLAPGSLRRAVTVMRKHPNVGLVYGRSELAREGRPVPEPSGRWRATKIWPGSDWIRLRCSAGRNCIFSPEAVVRTSIQRAVGFYDPVCHHTSDLNMWLRVAAVSDVAHIRGVAQAIYRHHADSMVHRDMQPTIDMRERRAAFDAFFATSASKLDEAEQLRELAARSLARVALWQASRAFERGSQTRVADDLAGFALDVYPKADRLREWRGLRMRRRIGAGRSRIFPPFLATRALDRLRRRASWRRMMSRGI